MIDNDTAIQYMRNEIAKFKVKQDNRIKSEGSMRCMFCGDSVKSSRTEHLYIKLKPDERDGVVYFAFGCKLCTIRRRVFSPDDIKTFKLSNEDLIEYILYNYNTQGAKVAKSSYNFIAKEFSIPEATCNIEDKKQYLRNRLGDGDVANHPEKYKIVLDLVSFFKANKLVPNTDYGTELDVKNLLQMLHTHGIGMISFDNTLINFRDTSKDNVFGKRYIQYRIYPEKALNLRQNNSEISGFYAIPGKIDSMAPNLIAVMSEGSFDILRVYADYFDRIDTNHIIFASVSNAHGYAPFITRYFEYGIIFNEIIIYSDDDVDISEYKKLVKPLSPMSKITIHYNDASKDFGDITKPVTDRIEIL